MGFFADPVADVSSSDMIAAAASTVAAASPTTSSVAMIQVRGEEGRGPALAHPPVNTTTDRRASWTAHGIPPS